MVVYPKASEQAWQRIAMATTGDARLFIAEEQTLMAQEKADTPPTSDLVAEWAKSLDLTLYSGSAQQRNALIRKLVEELRVKTQDEIIRTYRIPALVRAPGNQVDPIGVEPTASAGAGGGQIGALAERRL
jgi:hypothetical protein